MKENNLMTLNDALFHELKRLEGIDVEDKEQVETEVSRAKAVTDLAGNILVGSRLMLDAARLKADYSLSPELAIPRMLSE